MHIKDGTAYGDEPLLEITAARALPYHIMILTFSTGETRLFDAALLDGPVYESLKDQAVFEDFRLCFGVITWANGTIDCAPEFMYGHSYEYTPPAGEMRPASDICITAADILPGRRMKLTFSTGETRLFDASLLDGPVYEPLKDEAVFEDFRIEYGVITWANETIDCAPEFMYDHSYEYTPPAGKEL